MNSSKLFLQTIKVFYKLEDLIVRYFRQFPSRDRKDSFPYLSYDTYYHGSDFRIEGSKDVAKLGSSNKGSVIYLNGNSLPGTAFDLINRLDLLEITFPRLIIGDSDTCPEIETLRQLIKYFHEIYTVNLADVTFEKIKYLPLGLESQRYRSAGQIRDFTRLCNFNSRFRNIGILVAWNDETWPMERYQARETLRLSQMTFELRNRVPARYIHQLMRRTKLVPCPRGNGVDTHRFWESLYLGALPVLLKRDSLPGMLKWPHILVNSWDEVVEWNGDEIHQIYLSKLPELKAFRENASVQLAILGQGRAK